MMNKVLIGSLALMMFATGACTKSSTPTPTTTTSTNTTTSTTANRNATSNTTAPPASNTTSTTAPAPPASTEGKQDFTLHNATGIEIHSLYIAPHTDEEWNGDTDILGRDTLADGESVLITFSPKENAKLWDMKITDASGKSVEWNSLNLLEISDITLHYKDGQTTAEVK